MKYLLDTNIVVHFLRGAYKLDEKIRQVGIENCFVSEITLLELENSGPTWHDSQRKAMDNFIDAFDGRILPIRKAFNIYAKNRVQLRKSGQDIYNEEKALDELATRAFFKAYFESIFT